MIRNKKYSEIIDKLGLSPASFHKRNIMEAYLDNFWKKIKEYKDPKDFQRSITMALYTLDGIKDINKVILKDKSTFIHNDKICRMESHQLAWNGISEMFESKGEKDIMFEKIRDLINIFNSYDVKKIFVLELFSRTFIGYTDFHNNLKTVRFLSRYYIEKKDKGIKLLESNGL